MTLAFFFVGLFEGILIFILSGLIVFLGSRLLFRKLLKSRPNNQINVYAFFVSLILNPVTILAIIWTIMYYTPENQEYIKMRMEYEKQFIDEKDQQFTEASILGKTKEEILEKFGRADTTANSLVYNYSTFTSTFVVEIELEEGKAVRINKKKD